MNEVRKALRGFEPEWRLKVGCKDGNSYWYVGTVRDFANNMDAYDTELRSFTRRKMLQAEKALKTATKSAISPGEWARRETFKEDPTITLDAYMRALELFFKSITARKATLEMRKKALDCYVPLGKRKVVEAFAADETVEPHRCAVLVIEGREPGVFWTTDEAYELPAVKFEVEPKEEE